jgi:hypothetical protein
MKNHQEERTATNQPRKAYKAPNLQEYGSIRKLTAGGTSTAAENHPDISKRRP